MSNVEELNPEEKKFQQRKGNKVPGMCLYHKTHGSKVQKMRRKTEFSGTG